MEESGRGKVHASGLSPDAFDRAARAALLIKSSEHGEECSAAFVSRTGHALTAFHCLESCLEARGLLETDKTPESASCFHELYRAKARYPGEVYCGADGDEFKLVLLGEGRVGRFEDEAHPPEILERFRSLAAGDFALIKFPGLPKGASCVPVSPSRPGPGDRLWALGYPVETWRETHNANGSDKFISYGTIFPSVLEHPYAANWGHGLRQVMTALYERPEIMLSSIDLVDRMSGSMALDNRGRLVGINLGAVIYHQQNEPFRPITREFMDKNARSLRVTKILDDANRWLGASAAAEAFDCP